MVDFVKTLLIPGSDTFLLITVTIGVALLHGPARARRWAVIGLTVVTAAYWLMSLPLVADTLVPGSDRPRIGGSGDVAGAAAIVVVGAGVDTFVADGRHVTVPNSQTALNAFEAARIYSLHPVPVIAAGGNANPAEQHETESAVLRALLIGNQVPADRILVEAESRTTYEQAVHVAPILKRHRWEQFVLVAAPGHMPRAAVTFRAQGLKPILAVARFRAQPRPSRWWLPDLGSLDVSEKAMYDSLAWVFYWSRGHMAFDE